MEVAKFNASSDILISRCLDLMIENFYYGSGQVDKKNFSMVVILIGVNTIL